MSAKNILLLCKVVDNFGDAGFVLRLAKNLKKINPLDKMQIFTSEMEVFQNLCAQKNKNALLTHSMEFLGIAIFDWNESALCKEVFFKNPPDVILECFQCGRPKWLEEILFCKKDESVLSERDFSKIQSSAGEKISRIINIDYLTAENYAEDFHMLKSGTRSAFVKKINFMPGFTEKTGGLILDEPFLSCMKNREKIAQKNSGEKNDEFCENATPKKILVFSYPQNFSPIILAMEDFCKTLSAQNEIQICLAQGIGKESFLNDFLKLKNENSLLHLRLEELPFLPQSEWDLALLKMNLLFVRGEDSLSRACLLGTPFVWHAHPQDEDYHLVKVRALLERMRRHFLACDFAPVERLWLLYNGQGKSQKEFPQNLREACFDFLCCSRKKSFLQSFADFSKSLFSIGNFSQNLENFISQWLSIS